MNNRDVMILVAVLAWLFWPQRSTEVHLTKTCVFPDGTTADTPLERQCPYDAAHGGQSYLTEYEG